MRFTINPKTLSDGSRVYNVVGRADNGTAVVTFGATDREHAARLMGALDDCAFVDVDVAELESLLRDRTAMSAIHQALDGTEWGSETLDDVALIVTDTGRTIRDPDYEGPEG